MKKIAIRICSFIIFFFMICNIDVLAKEVEIKEKVVDFNLEMNVNTDSSVDVVETFSINATENMKDYIVKRSFPVEYDGRKIEIKNIKVLENGKNIDFKVNRKDRNVIINLNEKNQELSVGTHTYNIEYTVSNLIEFKKDNNQIRWHLFSDSWVIPTNNYSIKINFPDGTQLNKDEFKISKLTNGIEVEKVNMPVKFDNKHIEFSDNYLIYQGTDVILECSFNNDKIVKPTFIDNIGEFLNRNLISIIILILSVILFIFEMYNLKNREKQENLDTKIKILVMLASVIFIFIISILLGMNVNYNITMNYMKNVFIKFLSLLLFEGFIICVTYLSIRYELFEKNKLNQIASICVVVPLVSIGWIFLTNFFEDIYYNIFGYLVLIFVLISNISYVYNLKRNNF